MHICLFLNKTFADKLHVLLSLYYHKRTVVDTLMHKLEVAIADAPALILHPLIDKVTAICSCVA